MDDRRRDVALFRYPLIREAADPALTKAERGRLVRAVAARDHTGPGGERARIARKTLDRWVRNWRAGGFEALVPTDRSAEPVTPAAVVDLAVKLKGEAPGRTAAQVTAVIAAAQGAPGPSLRVFHVERARTWWSPLLHRTSTTRSQKFLGLAAPVVMLADPRVDDVDRHRRDPDLGRVDH